MKLFEYNQPIQSIERFHFNLQTFMYMKLSATIKKDKDEYLSYSKLSGKKFKSISETQMGLFILRLNQLDILNPMNNYINAGMCDGERWTFEIDYNNGCHTTIYANTIPHPKSSDVPPVLRDLIKAINELTQ